MEIKNKNRFWIGIRHNQIMEHKWNRHKDKSIKLIKCLMSSNIEDSKLIMWLVLNWNRMEINKSVKTKIDLKVQPGIKDKIKIIKIWKRQINKIKRLHKDFKIKCDELIK